MPEISVSFALSDDLSKSVHATHPVRLAATALCAAGLALYAFTPSIANAQSAGLAQPNAGQTLIDLPTSPGLLPNTAEKTGKPAVLVENPENNTRPSAITANSTEGTVSVKSFSFEGNKDIPSEILQTLVSKYVGQPQTVSQLREVSQSITAYYREHGFAVARAYLPTQDVTAGNIIIAVAEGVLSNVQVRNTSRLSDTVVREFFDDDKLGRAIRASEIERKVLLLQDTPGIAQSRATLQPGASVGTSDLIIEATAAPFTRGTLTLDNYGNRYLGEYRVSANAAIASPFGLGDQIDFSALSSLNEGPGLRFGRIAYQLPVGTNGLRVGTAFFSTQYRLGREFDKLDAQGDAKSASVFSAFPLIRSMDKNLSLTAAYESKKLNDRIDSVSAVTDKRLRIGSIGMAGSLVDSIGGGGISSFDASWAHGNLIIVQESARLFDAGTAQTQGKYSRFSYSASRLQRLGNTLQLSASFSGQKATKNLDSSEKFTLGGFTGVRAYPPGEGLGDEGTKITLELRNRITEFWQGIAFYDEGQVRINKNSYSTFSGDNNRALSGAGFGITGSFGPQPFGMVQVKASLAWRLHGGKPLSIPENAAKSPTLLVAVTVAF